MNSSPILSVRNLARDIPAGLVTFLVALPLCLGIALASNAPLFSGILAGIIGGLVVGALSGSHTSVAGPAAGLTAIVAAQIEALGSFEGLLAATVLAGMIQVGLGFAKAGFIARFFPSSVVKGLLAAIGVILILKQIPHAVGHDPDPIGQMSFEQPDSENTLSELFRSVFDIQPAAAVVGALAMLVLLGWDRVPWLKRLRVPVPLVVVVLGVVVNLGLSGLGDVWTLKSSHLVQVPILESLGNATSLLQFPDWGGLGSAKLYTAAFTIAIVASLETLLNLEAVDNLDPKQRRSPASRELVAQGAGNVVAGLCGGLPMTSVVIRSSVNVHAGNETKMSTIFHGLLLVACVLFVPHILNLIPLAALAAILIVTGFKLASPKLVIRMWREGYAQFLPFAVTVLAIVFTDLLQGILIGLAVSIGFVLRSNLRRPVKFLVEKRVTGEILRLEFGEQVSFLNRAALEKALHCVERGRHVLLDASRADYIDPDILDLVYDFSETRGPAHGVTVSLVGFKNHYSRLADNIQYLDHSTRAVQSSYSPLDVLNLLRAGNERFRTGKLVQRDIVRQIVDTAEGQAPLAAIMGCIDSRTPAELVFDAGLGDIFNVRVAGGAVGPMELGSLEYSCSVAGAKLLVVMGHSRCGAIAAAIDALEVGIRVSEHTGCLHMDTFVEELQRSVEPGVKPPVAAADPNRMLYVDAVAQRQVQRSIDRIMAESSSIAGLVRAGKVGIVGAFYDVSTGEVTFSDALSLEHADVTAGSHALVGEGDSLRPHLEASSAATTR